MDGTSKTGKGIYLDEAYWRIYNLTLTRYDQAIYFRNGIRTSRNNDVGYITVTNGASSGMGAYFVGSMNNRIHHSKIGGGWGWTLAKVEGLANEKSENITIEANELYDPSTHGPVDLSGNFVNIKIYSNIIHGGTSEAFYIHQTAVDGFPNSGYVDIYNNTIYDTATFIMFDDPAPNSVIRNNKLIGPINTRFIKVTENYMENKNIYLFCIMSLKYPNKMQSTCR